MWVRLDEIFEINPKNTNSDSDICGFVPMANVDDGFSGTHSYKERKWGEVKKGYCHFQNGDIAVAKISPCFENLKSTIFHSLPNNIGAGTTELVILRGHLVYGPYFLYLFKSQWYIGKGIVYFKGVVGQQRVNRDIFTSLEVPLPPLNEQRRIVSVIQRLFAVIDIVENNSCELKYNIEATKQKVLELAITGKLVAQDPSDEPAADLLQRVNPNAVVSTDKSHYKFDTPNNWIISQLGSLFNHNTGKALNRSNQEGRMLDYITTSNLYWDRFELNNLKQMPFKDSEIDKCTIIKGDLLVCEGGDVGRAAIWNYDSSICIQNHIHRLRPIDNHLVFPRFYYYCFLLYKQQNLIGGKGIGIQGLSSNQLHKVVFPLPPLNEQKRIASKVDELFAVIDQIQQSLE